MPTFGIPSHFDLSVSNAELSSTWYCNVLGLERLRRVDFDDRIMIVHIHPESGFIIGLIEHTVVPVSRFDDRDVGLDHVGFSVAERAHLDAWQVQLAALGVTHSPVQDTANGSALVFRDPDNIQLEFWWTRTP